MKIISYSSVAMFLVVTERQNRGDVAYSLSFMARAAGVSHVTWGRLEKGEGVYALDYIATAANALGYTLLELIQTTDFLCSLLMRGDVIITGYGYTTCADVPEEPKRASHEELLDMLCKQEEGSAVIEAAPKFGGLLAACLSFIRCPDQLAARNRRVELIR